jgi:hypothetical protein
MRVAEGVASNIEIKAFARDFLNQKEVAERLADQPPQLLLQEDVFFRVPQGRLKLRIIGPDRGELIAYSRSDRPTLEGACGIRPNLFAQ